MFFYPVCCVILLLTLIAVAADLMYSTISVESHLSHFAPSNVSGIYLAIA